MRILLSCLQDLRAHRIPAYRFWAVSFRNGIVEAGQEWAEVPGVDWAQGITHLTPEERRVWRDRTWSETLSWIAVEKKAGRAIDLFLSYLYPEQIETAALFEIRRQGIPCVNFFCDNLRQFIHVPPEFHHFDLHWVPEFEALPMYCVAGLKAVHAPMPIWIPLEQRGLPARENDRTTFIGSTDPLRRYLLGSALGFGAAIDIGGAGWRPSESPPSGEPFPLVDAANRWKNQLVFLRTHGMKQWLHKIHGMLYPPPHVDIPAGCLLPAVSDVDYFRLTKESMVTIGINRVPTFRRSWRDPLTYSRLRDLEAPMEGSCYLTEWTEGLTKLYEIGHEIETYRTAEEMVDKIDILKSDRSLRVRLRSAGQKRALADHTIACSLRKIGNVLGMVGL